MPFPLCCRASPSAKGTRIAAHTRSGQRLASPSWTLSPRDLQRSARVIDATLLIALMTLTAIGAKRRGRHLVSAVATGIFFPVGWIVWYLRDEQPLGRT